jgi:DNA-binding IclR family transcriptional regulator
MDITGRSNATVKRYLQILRVIGFAEFRGASKTGRYFITKDALSKISK